MENVLLTKVEMQLLVSNEQLNHNDDDNDDTKPAKRLKIEHIVDNNDSGDNVQFFQNLTTDPFWLFWQVARDTRRQSTHREQWQHGHWEAFSYAVTQQLEACFQNAQKQQNDELEANNNGKPLTNDDDSSSLPRRLSATSWLVWVLQQEQEHSKSKLELSTMTLQDVSTGQVQHALRRVLPGEVRNVTEPPPLYLIMSSVHRDNDSSNGNNDIAGASSAIKQEDE